MPVRNPLSPMPPAVAEELAAWKEGRREQPWTEAHQREAFVRLCELAIECRRRDQAGAAHSLLVAIAGYHGTEIGFRRIVADVGARFARASLHAEREVAIVRQRAERPATVEAIVDVVDGSVRIAAPGPGVVGILDAASLPCELAPAPIGRLDLDAIEDEIADARAVGREGLVDVPALVAEVRKLREENARLRAELREIADGPEDAATAAEAALGTRAEASDPPAWTPPEGTTVDPLYGSLEGPLLVALVTIEPGSEWPREVHTEHDEMIVMLSGKVLAGGRMDNGDVIDSVGVGDIAIVALGREHTIRNASTTEPATYLSVLRRLGPAVSPLAESVPPDSAEEFGHVLRVEAGEPHHLGQCEKCGRTNVVDGEWCPADQGEC